MDAQGIRMTMGKLRARIREQLGKEKDADARVVGELADAGLALVEELLVDVKRIADAAAARGGHTRPLLNPDQLPCAGDYADIRVQVTRCEYGKVFFVSDDGLEAHRAYSDIVRP